MRSEHRRKDCGTQYGDRCQNDLYPINFHGVSSWGIFAILSFSQSLAFLEPFEKVHSDAQIAN